MSEATRVVLEPLQAHHAAALFPALQDPRIYEFIDEVPPASVSALEARYAFLAGGAPDSVGETWLNRAVLAGPGRSPVGTVQATIPHGGGPTSVAYVLCPSVWGTGLAREAVRSLLDDLRSNHGVEVVQAEIEPDNTRSIRLATRLGFEHVDSVDDGGGVELIFRRHLRDEDAAAGPP